MQSLLTVRDLAAFAQVHPQTVYKLVETGEIPHIRAKGVGLRFRRDEIDQWLGRRATKPSPILTELPKVDLTLQDFDMMFLKGGHSNPVGSRTRWIYTFGTVYVRESKKGTRWYIGFSHGGRRIREVVRGAANRAEALVALKKRVQESFDGRFSPKRKSEGIAFAALAEKYLEDYAKIKKRSWRTDQGYVKANMEPFFKGKRLEAITPLDIERYIRARLESGVSKITVNRCLQILRKMFNLGMDWGFMESNPVRKVRLFSERENLKERILKLEEETALLDQCSAHLRPIIVAALNTGLRRGELLSLRWASIDLKARILKVERSKSGKPRFVEINSTLAALLDDLRRGAPSAEYVFSNAKTRLPFVEIGKAFRAACRRAKITGLRFHDLRHTFASRLIEAGVDIITVRDLLGHSSVKLTERYTHSRSELKRRAVEILATRSPETMAQIGHKKEGTTGSAAIIPLFSVN